MTGQTGDHDQQRHIRLHGQAQLLLQLGLAGGLADGDGLSIVVSRQSRIGLGIEGVVVNAVDDAGELPRSAGDDAVQAVGIVGVHQLTGVGLGDGGDQVTGLDGTLHDVDGAVHIQDVPVLPGQTQHIIEEVGVGPALILDVVDGVHDLGLGEHVAVLGLQVGGDQSGLPVVALHDIGDEADDSQGVQAGLGEVGVTLVVVVIAVDGTGTGAEVVVVVDEVDGDLVLAVGQLHDAAVQVPPAQADLKLGDLLDLVLGIFLDLLVVGQDQDDLVAFDAAQRSRQGLHDVTQTAGLGVGCALRS